MELIIVIGIIGIMTAVGIGSISSTKNSTKLKAARTEVAATIKTAQNYALQGKVQSGETVCGYGVYFEDNEKYHIFYVKLDGMAYANCNEQNNNCSFTDLCEFKDNTNAISIENYTLPNGVTLATPATTDDANFFFDIPHGNAYNNGTNPFLAPGAVDLEFEISGKTSSITINSRGSIMEN